MNLWSFIWSNPETIILFILSVKYRTVPYFIERVATLSLNIAVTLHNLQYYVTFWQINYGLC